VLDVVDQIAATNLSRTLRAFTSAAVSGCGSTFSAVTTRGSATFFSGALAGAGALDGVDQISAADNSPMAVVRAGAVACCAALFECVCHPVRLMESIPFLARYDLHDDTRANCLPACGAKFPQNILGIHKLTVLLLQQAAFASAVPCLPA
jgi:hypothetical protein